MSKAKIFTILLAVMIGISAIQAEKAPSKITLRIPSGLSMNYDENDSSTYINRAVISCFYNNSGRMDSLIYVYPMFLTGSNTAKENTSYVRIVKNTYSLQWEDSKLTVKRTDGSQRNTVATQTYILNAAGNIDYSISENTHLDGTADNITRHYSYNENNELISREIVSESDNEKVTLTVENGNAVKVSGKHGEWPLLFNYFSRPANQISVSYSNIPNKGKLYLPLNEYLAYEYNPVPALAGILGKPSKYLPASEYNSDKRTGTFSYTLNDEGYITKFSYNENHRGDMMYVYIDYQEINGVSEIATDNTIINIDGRNVSTSDNSLLLVYDMQGRLIGSAKNGIFELPQSGIYLLRAGTKTIKAAVR